MAAAAAWRRRWRGLRGQGLPPFPPCSQPLYGAALWHLDQAALYRAMKAWRSRTATCTRAGASWAQSPKLTAPFFILSEHRKSGVCGELPQGQHPLHEAAGLRHGLLVQRTAQSPLPAPRGPLEPALPAPPCGGRRVTSASVPGVLRRGRSSAGAPALVLTWPQPHCSTLTGSGNDGIPAADRRVVVQADRSRRGRGGREAKAGCWGASRRLDERRVPFGPSFTVA